jgi:hypothetical protein
MSEEAKKEAIEESLKKDLKELNEDFQKLKAENEELKKLLLEQEKQLKASGKGGVSKSPVPKNHKRIFIPNSQEIAAKTISVGGKSKRVLIVFVNANTVEIPLGEQFDIEEMFYPSVQELITKHDGYVVE